MVQLIVWGVAVVVALLILGIVGYGLAGAFGRLTREIAAAQEDVRPLLEQAQAVAADRS